MIAGSGSRGGTSKRAIAKAKILRNFANSLTNNPELNGTASGVTATVNNTDDTTLTRLLNAKALAVNNLVAATGGQLYYSDTSTRSVITSNNLSGDSGNLGGNLPNIVPTAPAGENMFGPSYYHIGTDSPKVQIRYAPTTTGFPVRVRVDGRYVDKTGWEMQSNNYLTLDFGGIRRPRTISFETNGSGLLFSVRIDNLSRFYNPTPADPLRIIQYGDSQTQGGNPAVPSYLNTNSRIYADLIGAWDFRNASVRGSGYVSAGSSGLLVPLGTTMDYSINQKVFDMVEIAAGFNDVGKVISDVQAAALAAWKKARLAQPNALIVVWGIWGAATGPGTSVLNLENALKATFTSWNDPFSVFIPVSTGFEPWEFGTGKSGSTNGTGNSDFYVEPDGLHATLAGHEYRGYRRAAAIRQAVTGIRV